YVESGASCLQGGVNGWYAGVSGVACTASNGISCMQQNSAARCYNNYSEAASVFQSSAAACLNYCNSNNAEACEWNSSSGQCYVRSEERRVGGEGKGWYAGEYGVESTDSNGISCMQQNYATRCYNNYSEA